MPSAGSNGSHTNSNNSSSAGNKEIPQHELEKKVMATFSRSTSILFICKSMDAMGC